MNKTVFTTLAVLLLSGSAVAQNQDNWQTWPLADHFTVSANAFFQNLDTRIRLDASDASPGTTVDFEQNLGMSDTETLPGLSIGWRFAKKHRLQFETSDLKRSGSGIAATDIRFGDEVFTVDLPISSFFDINVIGLNYSYSFVFDEKKEVAIDLGLAVQDIKFGLIGNEGLGIIEATSGLTAPLPTLGLRGGYAFTDKWIGKAGAGVFSVDLAISDGEQLNGEVISAYASIQHKTFEHLHFGLSYAYFDVGVDFKESGLVSSMNYKYQGPVVSIVAVF